jgi:dipeptidyl aminopeptidase/acylaminoacyl peptidase
LQLHVHSDLDLQTLFRVPSIYNYDVSPKDESIAFSWNRLGQYQIYLHNIFSPDPRLLTRGTNSKISPCFSPDGNKLAYMQDYDGDENFDIFLLDLLVRESPLNLTPETKEAIHSHVRWSPDGKKLAFALDQGGKFSIYTLSLSGGGMERISDHEFCDSDPEWSPDGKMIAFNALVTAQDHGVFTVPSKGGEILRLMDGEKPIEASSPKWSPDGKRIAFESNELGSSNIGIWDLKSGSVQWVTKTQHQCYDPQWFPDERKLSYLVGQNGNLHIAVQDMEKHVTDYLEVEAGVHLQIRFGRNPRRMYFTFSNLRRPPDLWTVDLENRKFHQLTNSFDSVIDSSRFVLDHDVLYQSRDGLEIPGLLYLPRNFDSQKAGPSVICVHGGPTIEHVNEWHPLIQYLVGEGYVVIAPNYRGSPGFGRKFQTANRFALGDKDLQDVVAAADYLIEKRLTDPRRIGIVGESYGGYLTMCALTKFPNYWAAGVAMVPFLNWFTEIKNEREDLQAWDLENMGHPEKDYQRFHDASPIFFIDNLRAPVQLIAGAHDPRCPASESRQAQKKLQESGKVFELVIYEDEGHEFRKLENRVDTFRRLIQFLNRHLSKN